MIPDLSQCAAIVKQEEGCALVAYQDSGGVWTAGYGHIRGVGSDTRITQAQADDWLLNEDLPQSYADVMKDVKVELTPNQIEALVSFTFNEGEGHLRGSTLLAKLNAGDFAGACAEFPRWDKVRGNVVAGLLNRRKAEQALFLRPV